MKGYQERVYKAIEIAGGKVKRRGGSSAVQSEADFETSMSAWAAATQHLGA